MSNLVILINSPLANGLWIGLFKKEYSLDYFY
nr:MAG TPA: hypothetical protein [Caudoviricetes sp.]DAW11252.1 MAG TPA: hypothetical protein [Caudoviricetes sp.]